jgi:hypothetical protein
VDQGVARKAKQKPESEMEETKTAAASEAERCHIKCEMKAPRIDPAVQELAVLSALAALGCGLAAAQGDLWFVTVFGAASIVTIIEVVRRLL